MKSSGSVQMYLIPLLKSRLILQELTIPILNGEKSLQWMLINKSKLMDCLMFCLVSFSYQSAASFYIVRETTESKLYFTALSNKILIILPIPVVWRKWIYVMYCSIVINSSKVKAIDPMLRITKQNGHMYKTKGLQYAIFILTENKRPLNISLNSFSGSCGSPSPPSTEQKRTINFGCSWSFSVLTVSVWLGEDNSLLRSFQNSEAQMVF